MKQTATWNNGLTLSERHRSWLYFPMPTMVCTHFKLGRPVVGECTAVGNLYDPKTQRGNHHPRRLSLTITPKGPLSMRGLHLSCWIIGLTFMLLALCVSFMSSIAVIVHFKDFTTVLNSTHSASFCPVLTDLWEKINSTTAFSA